MPRAVPQYDRCRVNYLWRYSGHWTAARVRLKCCWPALADIGLICLRRFTLAVTLGRSFDSDSSASALKTIALLLELVIVRVVWKGAACRSQVSLCRVLVHRAMYRLEKRLVLARLPMGPVFTTLIHLSSKCKNYLFIIQFKFLKYWTIWILIS